MYNTYETQLSNIDIQLKQNSALIDAADVVFVCGRSNSFLTTISLKVGEMQCKKKTKIDKSQTNLVVLNNELNTTGLMELLEKIKVTGIHRLTHLFFGATFSDLLTALEKGNAVTVFDHVRTTSYDQTLLEMADKSLSGMVIVHRFMLFPLDPEPGTLMKAFKRNTCGYGLNILFIETVKDKETGQVSLEFSHKTR